MASYLVYVIDTIRIADGVAEQNFRLRSEGVDIEGVVVESTLGGNYVKRDGILKGETISQASAKWPAAIWPSRSKTRPR